MKLAAVLFVALICWPSEARAQVPPPSPTPTPAASPEVLVEPSSTVGDDPRQTLFISSPARERDWFDVGQMVTSTLLIALAFSQLLLLRKTLKATEAAALAARDSVLLSHRPELIVRSVSSKRLTDYSIAAAGTPIDLECHVANVGTSACTITGIELSLIFGELPMKPPYFDDTPVPEVSKHLPPGTTITIEQTEPSLVDKPLVALGILHREQPLYFTCLLDYVDLAGQKRRTAACRRFDYSLGRFVDSQNPDYEYRD